MNIAEHIGQINSATKYPSILTYHEMGERGRLADTVQVPFSEGDDIIATEKIDGANARMIFFPSGDFIIGSREGLLYYSGDMLHNPRVGIVDALKEVATRISERIGVSAGGMTAVYGEVYGGKIAKASKNYTGKKAVAFRLFDVINFNADVVTTLMVMPREGISSWRQHGGQSFVGEDLLARMADVYETPLVPRIPIAGIPPTEIPATLEWMAPHAKTQAAIDDDGKSASEGIVIRTTDRSRIAKMRFEDYSRTLR